MNPKTKRNICFLASFLLGILTPVIFIFSPILESTSPPLSNYNIRPTMPRPLIEPTYPVPEGRDPLTGSSDQLFIVDNILKKLNWGTYSFNTFPEFMNFYDERNLHLVLHANMPAEELKRLVRESGHREAGRLRISNYMRASLVSNGFVISSIMPEDQAISADEATHWIWQINPKKTGTQTLHLTVAAIIKIDGTNMPRTLRTFEKHIFIEVTYWQLTKSFVLDNLVWLGPFVLIPLGVWIFSKFKKDKAA